VLLTNGRYATLATAAGTGRSTWSDLALTAWRGDPTEDADGFYVYLRDAERGTVWSAGHQPVKRATPRYVAREAPGMLAVERLDTGIETRLEVAVVPDADLELRRIRLRNRSSRARRIEVTTYAEVVLGDAAAHAAHPAFSKLFVTTECSDGVLLAHRRPRSAVEKTAWLVHALAGPGRLQWETDRARFLGRGRTPARPRALATRLSGTVGNVLDPVVSLRRTVRIAPGATVELVALLGAAETREAALALAAWATDRRRRAAPFAVAAGPAEPLAAARPARPRFRPATGARVREGAVGPADLLFDNGTGGFTPDGREYVLRVGPDRRPPMPWINVMANERVGCLASEAGAGYTWSRNSHEHRLTPWSNDPVSDPHGEALWIRDEEARVFWSPLPGPTPPAATFEVAHGFGYTRWRHASQGLVQEVRVFVAREDPVKVIHLRVTNTGRRRRRLAVFSYFHLVLGVLPSETAPFVETTFDAARGILHARNSHPGDFAGGTVFAAAVVPGAAPVRVTADRAAFLGPYGSPARPAALATAAALDGRTGAGLDPCFAFQVPLRLAPGETADVAFLLGEADDADAARALVGGYREPDALGHALEGVRALWTHSLGAVQIETPSGPLDLMVNGWLAYQAHACRLCGRSAFYQSGGAVGFRDQLQDALALVWLRPELTRAQLLLHAAHQFVEGDVLHWWHPPIGRGTRTRFSDDLAWLPYATASYVGATGDWGVLDEPAPFVTARELATGEDEAYLLPSVAVETADLYAHCCRALERALTHGSHGLPLMGTGDWNDGMNRVGREGRGESVWLGFFLHHVLDLFLPLSERRGDAERARRWRDERVALAEALEDAGWDGGWYRRAYYDDGTPLGTSSATECRIDALVQAWAVISGVAPPDRAARAMDAVERLLISDKAGLIKLLTPPFDKTDHDPGYIKGYVPGIRENGGQYTHAALWVVRAMAELGRRERATQLLEMLTPVDHARTPKAVAVYQVEPYVVAADVYATAPHVGRGGWTWYTGAAGWMLRVALESVLGLTLEGGTTLRVAPRIPDSWPAFRFHLRLPNGETRWEVEVRNPNRIAETVVAVEVDGAPGVVIDGAALIPLDADGRTHAARVLLGPRVSP
jgi:N,N'-diacetylchitobiose phosphorylase